MVSSLFLSLINSSSRVYNGSKKMFTLQTSFDQVNSEPRGDRKMEKFQNMMACKLPFLLGIFLLFCCVKAENRTYPTANLNLSPFQQWRSAYFCLLNVSSSCPDKYVLNMSGWLNVTHEDGEAFCAAGGCAEHTRLVLNCVHHVKRDFYFANKATVKHLNATITIGCNSSQGFNGTSLYPH